MASFDISVAALVIFTTRRICTAL